MLQLVYESSATRDITEADVSNIMSSARVNNAKAGVTGMLVYHEGMFIQVLEGPEDKVTELFAHIERDPRHEDVWRLACMTINARSFSNWSMGLASELGETEAYGLCVRDLNGIKRRLNRLRNCDPKGEGAYTAKLVRRFLDRLTPKLDRVTGGNKMETSL